MFRGTYFGSKYELSRYYLLSYPDYCTPLPLILTSTTTYICSLLVMKISAILKSKELEICSESLNNVNQ